MKNLSDQSDFMKMYLNGLITIGFWPGNNRFHKYYRIYTYVMLSQFFITCTINLYFVFEILPVFITNLAMVFIIVDTLCKGYPIICLREKMEPFINWMNENINRERKNESKKRQKNVENSFKKGSRVFIVYNVICGTSGFLFLATPALSPLLMDTPENVTIPRQLPHLCWYPFDTSPSPIFEIIYFVQIFSTYVHCMTISLMDCFYISFVIGIISQLKGLAIGFEEINQVSSESRRNELGRLIRQHQMIIKFSESFNEFCKPMMTMNWCAIGGILCTLIFQVSQTEIASIQFAMIMIFLTLELFHLFIFGYFGSDLVDKSFKVTHSVYNCGWEEWQIDLKKCISFIISRAQKPLVVTAWIFGVSSLELSLALLRASYSYYALLQQMNDDIE